MQYFWRRLLACFVRGYKIDLLIEKDKRRKRKKSWVQIFIQIDIYNKINKLI